MAPRLSVVMPTFDGAAFVGRALSSVAAQADGDVEVVVADDGSTDETLALVTSFSSRLALRVLERPHDGSWVRGTNLALRAATGDHVSFLHQDDAWREDRLARLRGVVAEHDLVVHATQFVGADDRPLGRWTCPLPAGVVAPSTLQRRLAVQNCVGLPSTVFRRAVALDAGPLDEACWFTADWDFWGRLASRARSVLHVPDSLSLSRVHRAAQTASRTADVADLRRQVALVQGRILDDVGRPPGLARAAAFNCEVTVALASAAHRRPVSFAALARTAARLRPADWIAFARAARVAQRVLPRARAAVRR